MSTIFHKIADKQIPAYVIAEDDKHLAFLDIFPASPAQVVVIPKDYQPSQFSRAETSALLELTGFAQSVARQMEQKLENVLRVVVVIEGLEIDYLHIKLYPVYIGTPLSNFSGTEKTADSELAEIQSKLTA